MIKERVRKNKVEAMNLREEGWLQSSDLLEGCCSQLEGNPVKTRMYLEEKSEIRKCRQMGKKVEVLRWRKERI